MNKKSILLSSLLLCAKTLFGASSPHDFVDLHEIAPQIKVEMRYSGLFNFTLNPLPGYESNTCWLDERAAHALAKVQQELELQQLGLKVFDCYRPKEAIKAMSQWYQRPNDRMAQKMFYPNQKKNELYSNGWIGKNSTHISGLTVDLTIIQRLRDYPDFLFYFPDQTHDCTLNHPLRIEGIDMGSNFDCFDEISMTHSPLISKSAQDNRKLLLEIMEKYGFVNYPKEWWHFRLITSEN